MGRTSPIGRTKTVGFNDGVSLIGLEPWLKPGINPWQNYLHRSPSAPPRITLAPLIHDRRQLFLPLLLGSPILLLRLSQFCRADGSRLVPAWPGPA